MRSVATRASGNERNQAVPGLTTAELRAITTSARAAGAVAALTEFARMLDERVAQVSGETRGELQRAARSARALAERVRRNGI